jgi:hypothetical protein
MKKFLFRFYTLVPAGILVGLGAAPMWASKATYLTQLGQVYAKLTDQAVEAIIVRFFGFFFLAWQSAELWGNLISSLGKKKLFIKKLFIQFIGRFFDLTKNTFISFMGITKFVQTQGFTFSF